MIRLDVMIHAPRLEPSAGVFLLGKPRFALGCRFYHTHAVAATAGRRAEGGRGRAAQPLPAAPAHALRTGVALPCVATAGSGPSQ